MYGFAIPQTRAIAFFELVDVARSSSVWQGVAEGRIPEESLNNPGPAVDEAIRSIFRKFPDATTQK